MRVPLLDTNQQRFPLAHRSAHAYGLAEAGVPHGSPGHLLLLDHALADHLMEGRLDEGRGNHLAVPIPVTIIWNERLVQVLVGESLVVTEAELRERHFPCVCRIPRPIGPWDAVVLAV